MYVYYTIFSAPLVFALYYLSMNDSPALQPFFDEAWRFLTVPNAFRSVLILMISMLLAYWLSRFLAQAIIRVAHKVSDRSERESDDQRSLRYRQIETYLGITVATVRVVIVMIVGYVTWRILSPFATENQATNSLAAIGAGTFFVVIAGQTVGIVLRDLTAGSVMITEGWFHVGDYVKIEPFMDVAGVVERFTLRSTRLRALNGEILWVHNQHITGVHVTPKGVRTIAVEVFVKDKARGEAAIGKIVRAIPTGKTMLAKPLTIVNSEKWGDEEWHFTVRGQTPPGREWLVEDYFLKAVEAIDNGKKRNEKILAHPPMVHMADDDADRKFRRSIRVK